jgi:crotonobetainyl-CoA:carnitine CoA-transferase CaiB-like acyl-CoA transferase
MPETALAGLRVVDATQMLAGPLAATRLGDLGADVIKLEAPAAGEFNRTHGFEDIAVGGEMTTFLSVNRNKRSLALDLKDPAARAALLELLADTDVFLQNFRAGTATRLGIGYEQLAAVNPRLIYCSISGYGPSGALAGRPGQDLVLQGYSGSMWSVGKEGDPPTPGALWAADVGAGYQAAIAILAALHERGRSGLGQHVEVDMLSVVLDAQLQELVTFLNTGVQPRRTTESSAHGSIPAPYGVYRTSDGWLTLAMCPLPALGEVLDDDRLRALTAYNDGHEHRDEIYGWIRHQFADRTTADWLTRCDEHGVWAGPVYDYEQLAADPGIAEAGVFVEQPHYTGETVRTVRVPIRMSRTAPTIRRGAPALGEHSREVLAEAGVASAVIDALTANGTVRQWKPAQPTDRDQAEEMPA